MSTHCDLTVAPGGRVKRGRAALLASLLLFALSFASAGCGAVFGPNVEEEHERLAKITDATVRDLNIEVVKVTDGPSIECTALVGWVNTGEFRKSRTVQVKAHGLEQTRELANRLSERWRAEGFEASVKDMAERGIYVSAKDAGENSLSFVGHPNSGYSYLSSQTACRKP